MFYYRTLFRFIVTDGLVEGRIKMFRFYVFSESCVTLLSRVEIKAIFTYITEIFILRLLFIKIYIFIYTSFFQRQASGKMVFNFQK